MTSETLIREYLLSQLPRQLEISSRIKGMLSGTSPSDGASCNTFIVEDSIDGENGIAASFAWATKISQKEGAPTLVLSKLRPAGSKVSSGGTASGACSFARVYDTIALTMLRPTKKNGVTVLFLDADHPEILEWLRLSRELKRAYTGVLFRPGKQYDDELLTAIATAYDTHQLTYLCKVTRTEDDRELYPNVCTEIRQGHKGVCTLSALKAHEMDLSPLSWVSVGRDVGAWMYALLTQVSKPNMQAHPELYQFEPQVGIGLVGLANLFGQNGITYRDALTWGRFLLGEMEMIDTPTDLARMLAGLTQQKDNSPLQFWVCYVLFCLSVIEEMPGVTRIFTQQPTAHTALRLSHKVGGVRYSVAPEIAPPYAVRSAADGLSRATQQSELRGDRELIYPAFVEVRDEVPALVYEQVAEVFQLIWDYFGKGHTLSYSTYRDVIDLAAIKQFLISPLQSWYYRLDPTPASTFDKTNTWDSEGDLGDLFEQEEPTGTCSLDRKSDCEVCSM